MKEFVEHVASLYFLQAGRRICKGNDDQSSFANSLNFEHFHNIFKGISHIAAILLLFLAEYDAFSCLINLSHSHHFLSFLRGDMREVRVWPNIKFLWEFRFNGGWSSSTHILSVSCLNCMTISKPLISAQRYSSLIGCWLYSAGSLLLFFKKYLYFDVYMCKYTSRKNSNKKPAELRYRKQSLGLLSPGRRGLRVQDESRDLEILWIGITDFYVWRGH